MTYTLYLLAFLWCFWALYVMVMGVYRAHLSGRLSRAGYMLGMPWVILGYLVDVLAQFTVATLFFADLPRRGEWHVLERWRFEVMHTRAGAVKWFKVTPAAPDSDLSRR